MHILYIVKALCYIDFHMHLSYLYYIYKIYKTYIIITYIPIIAEKQL